MIKAKLILCSVLVTLVGAAVAVAQETGGSGGGSTFWVIPNLHIFAVAIAAFGGAIGDSRAIAAACEGTARNPAAGGRIFTMLLLGLALIETLVLFTFLTLFIK
jgi:F-type H+-transporting ATPase subunit c